MTKKTFTYLVVGIVFGLLFSLGLCMALLPQWNAFIPGAVCTAMGLIGLLGLFIAYRKNSGKGLIKVDPKIAGRVFYGVISALIMGVGMCLIMVWQLMIPGIIVGIAGIVMLLFLIPMIVGFKDEEE